MPAQPTWYHRLDEILTTLHTLQSSHLDRLAMQKLFGVGERRARQLMAGLPSLQVGNAVAVGREALINRLETTARGERCQWEVSRHARVAASLESIRKHAAARRVQIPTAPDSRDRMVCDLSGGIELRPGELRILFQSAEELASKLFEVSQAMANDWSAFIQAVEEPSIK